MILLVEIGDFRRFERPRQLMAYLGLVPSEYSSGDRERRGALTKAGNTHARRVLVEAAWHYRHRPGLGRALAHRSQGQPAGCLSHAWRAQQRLHRRYRHLVGHGKRPPLAVAAVARELVGFIAELPARVPGAVRLDPGRPGPLPRLLPLYNTKHRHGGLGLLTPADVHHGLAEERVAARATVLATAYAAHPERFPGGLPKPPARPVEVWINRPARVNEKVSIPVPAGSAILDPLRAASYARSALSGAEN